MTNRIAEYRKRKGLTQAQLGPLIGYGSWVSVSKLEREVIDIKLPMLRKLAAALDCRPYELIMEPEDIMR